MHRWVALVIIAGVALFIPIPYHDQYFCPQSLSVNCDAPPLSWGPSLFQKLLLAQKVSRSSDKLPNSTNTETAEWKIYKNEGKYKYEVSYPGDWSAHPHKEYGLGEGVGLASSEGAISNGKGVRITCPADFFGDELPKPPDFNYITDYTGKPEYYGYLKVNNMRAIQWILNSTLVTAVLREKDPIVCQFETGLIEGTKDSKSYEQTIEQQAIYNKIIGSFKFIQ